MSEFFRFKDDGRITGYRNPNERFWKIVDNKLFFLTKCKEISAEFDETIIEGENIKLIGKHVLHGANGPIFYLDSQKIDYQPKEFAPTKYAFPGKTIGTHT